MVRIGQMTSTWSRHVVPVASFLHVGLQCEGNWSGWLFLGYLLTRGVLVLAQLTLERPRGSTRDVQATAFLVLTVLAMRQSLPPPTRFSGTFALIVVGLQKSLGLLADHPLADNLVGSLVHTVPLLTACIITAINAPLRAVLQCVAPWDTVMRGVAVAFITCALDAPAVEAVVELVTSKPLQFSGKNVWLFLSATSSTAVSLGFLLERKLLDRFVFASGWRLYSVTTVFLLAPLPLRRDAGLSLLATQVGCVVMAELLSACSGSSSWAVLLAAAAVLLESASRAKPLMLAISTFKLHTQH